MTQLSKKQLYIYSFIGILLIVILITIYFYNQPKKIKLPERENKYISCNQRQNASAPIEPADVIADKNEIYLFSRSGSFIFFG